MCVMCLSLLFSRYGDHRDLHVLTHSFPTRRSSDLMKPAARRCLRTSCMQNVSFLGPLRHAAFPFFSPCTGLPRAAGRTNLDLTARGRRSEEHTSELQSLMRISYAVFCLKKKTIQYPY